MTIATLSSRTPWNAPIWAEPFRPFFLAASVSALLFVLPWLGHFLGAFGLVVPDPALIWHMHEMLYGFGGAALSGFLLTALPAWSGAPLLRGAPLAALLLAWVVARVAMLASGVLPPALVMVLTIPHPVALSALLVWLAAARGDGRHRVFAPIAVAYGLLQPLMQLAWVAPDLLDGLVPLTADPARHLGSVGIMLFMLFFTAAATRVAAMVGPEAIRLSGTGRTFRAAPPRARAAIGLLALYVAILALWPESTVIGWLAWAAAAAHLDRVGDWRVGRGVRFSFFHGILAGKLFLICGLILAGAARVLPDLASAEVLDAAWHACAAGALGTAGLTVFSIATTRHSGREFPLPRLATVAIWTAICGSLLRVAAPFLWDVGLAGPAFWGGGLLWSAAFAVFLAGPGRLSWRAAT